MRLDKTVKLLLQGRGFIFLDKRTKKRNTIRD